MAGCYRSSRQRGRCAQTGQCARLVWCIFWCASGSGSVHEPSALQGSSAPAAGSEAPASAQPVDGRVLNAFSGDELVYNKTLGDWRTHNGVDYACAQGGTVAAPAAGKVTAAGPEGNWGTVVSIEDASGRIWRVCGVANPAVKAGDTVTAGQKLGTAGTVAVSAPRKATSIWR